ncbi:flavin reductase family protein [Solibacillus sp. FSL H8-0538]|uniref:flavin reductase family protein n=1 Tax=Solibacillus sp. FSL H8-0538 TaxID=2921400 RepID=UPI0030F9511B
MDDRLFRTAMGKFATGVTVITTKLNNEIYGMTANAFMSVSLNPKLVVISVGEKASMLERIKQSNKFTVNILAEDQQYYSQLFAGQIKDPQKVDFDDINGAPAIPGAIAQISCEVATSHAEGDHTLFIGHVLDVCLQDGNPLLFFNGQYSELKEKVAIQ